MWSITKTLNLDFKTDSNQYEWRRSITCIGNNYEIIRLGNLYSVWQETPLGEIPILGGATQADVESWIESLYIEFFKEEFPGYWLTFNWV